MYSSLIECHTLSGCPMCVLEVAWEMKSHTQTIGLYQNCYNSLSHHIVSLQYNNRCGCNMANVTLHPWLTPTSGCYWNARMFKRADFWSMTNKFYGVLHMYKYSQEQIGLNMLKISHLWFHTSAMLTSFLSNHNFK